MRRTQIVMCAGFVLASWSTVNAQSDLSTRLAGAAEEKGVELSGPNTGQPQPGVKPPEVEAPAEPAAPEEAAINAGSLSFSLGVDWTSAYFFRGLRQEEDGLIVQPWATVNAALWSSDSSAVGFTFGTWNSVHDNETAAGSADETVSKWYESDVFVGLTGASGKWSGSVLYYWYTSPSSAFSTIEELDVNVAFDDSEWLGDFKLAPSATLAIESGDDYADGADAQRGMYLQLGVSPGFAVDAGRVGEVTFSFPVAVGLSLSDYYEDSAGEDDAFGFASVSAKASIPLPVNDAYGAWTLTASVQGLFMGDNAASFNEDDDTQFLGTVGISVAY